MCPRPVSRLVSGLRSASSLYLAYCCQYLGPGAPVIVRVPRLTARVNASRVASRSPSGSAVAAGLLEGAGACVAAGAEAGTGAGAGRDAERPVLHAAAARMTAGTNRRGRRG